MMMITIIIITIIIIIIITETIAVIKVIIQTSQRIARACTSAVHVMLSCDSIT
jgi:hypothetical protein